MSRFSCLCEHNIVLQTAFEPSTDEKKPTWKCHNQQYTNIKIVIKSLFLSLQKALRFSIVNRLNVCTSYVILRNMNDISVFVKCRTKVFFYQTKQTKTNWTMTNVVKLTSYCLHDILSIHHSLLDFKEKEKWGNSRRN